MDLVVGTIGNLTPKLLQLLGDEYKLQKGLRKKVKFVLDELDSIHAALRNVAAVPRDQLDEQVKVWACQVREASYDMEDILDSFLVRVEGREPGNESRLIKRALKKMGGLFGKVKARHDIAGAIDDIEKQLQEVAQRRDRYRVDQIVAKPAVTSTIDPRIVAMSYTEVTRPIGIAKSSGELISKLSLQDGNDSNGKTKIVSVVGVGGLGKTTLVKAVYDKLKPRFGCGAFVPVGRNPDLKKVLRDILIDLDNEYMHINYNILDVGQLIKKLRDFLGSKRYFIVIDDVWDVQTWKIIKSALDQKNGGSRVITTTRNREVASSEEVYELEKLSDDNSKKLFYTRLFGDEAKCPANHPVEASERILQKCGGVPLAIITMASLLVGKSEQDWFDMCNSPGFYRGRGNNQQVDDTEWILSLSYYDLPPNLKTCLLYLSMYPEDCVIEKESLIWKWIAEGFIERKTETSLFQRGEEYFHELINRSMIQLVESKTTGIIYGCRVHDMVLDLICGLSDEENFVAIVSNNFNEGTSPSRNKVRRLAHQNRMMKQTQQDEDLGVTQVRSLVAYRCDVRSWVLHPSFELLRVLAIEGCRVPWTGWQGLKHIGNLLHLRYLGLRDMIGDYQLPEEIGKLKFLQTLYLSDFCKGVLPLGVCQLTQLVCLHGGCTYAPDGLLMKLKSLEELHIGIDNLNEESKRQFMKDLGNLSEARVLDILGTLKGVESELVQSLGKLHKLQHLELTDQYSGPHWESGEWGTVVLPRHLQHLGLGKICFHRLPLWISPVHLPSLCHLWLSVDHLDDAGLRALGGLPELREVELELHQPFRVRPFRTSMASTAIEANITVGDGFFKKLRCFRLSGCMVHFVLRNEDPTSVSFSLWNGKSAMAFGRSRTESDEHISRSVAPAVMPNLQVLQFEVPVRALYKEKGSCDNLGLDYLPSLREVMVFVDCEGAFEDDLEKIKDELFYVGELHPNKPEIQIGLRYQHKMMAQSPDQDGDESRREKEGQISLAGDEVAGTPSS